MSKHERRITADPHPVDFDGVFDDEVTGSYNYIGEAHFLTKAQAERWLFKQLKELDIRERAVKPGFLRRLFSQ